MCLYLGTDMFSKREKSFLSVARYFAGKSSQRYRHGAVIIKGGSVIGTGYNKGRNNPNYISPEHIKSDGSYHAEEVAIKNAGESIQGATIYVARINKTGQDRDSRPCKKCMAVIKDAGIKKVIYTTNSGRINVYN